MKQTQIVTILFLALATVFSSTLSTYAEVREWTSASGDIIRAEFVERQGDTVVLNNEDGEAFRIQMNKLSRDDQLFIGKQQLATSPAQTDKEQEIPEALRKLFGKKLVNAKKHRTSVAELQGKKIGIYFSAHWCPPCRKFTPQLVKFYNDLQQDGKPFEIVFVSSDKNEKAMIGYMKETDMPWLAVRHGSKEAEGLSQRFKVRGIPTLIIVDDQGKTLSTNGRGDVSRGTAVFDKW